jgi:hypothetical protein
MIIEIEATQVQPGEVNTLQALWQERLNNGWTFQYLFNIDLHSFTCVYTIWGKKVVTTKVK